MWKNKYGRILVIPAFILVMASIGTACGPSPAYSAIKLDVQASPYSSEAGIYPPAELDQLSILSATEQEAQLTAQGSTCCHREWDIDKGWASWSVYFTERATRWICENGPGGLAAISGIAVVVTQQWVAWLGAWGGAVLWKACDASHDTDCLRIRMGYWMGVIGFYKADSTKPFCRVDWRSVGPKW